MDFFSINSLTLYISDLQIIIRDTTPDWYLFDCIKNREKPEYTFKVEVRNNNSKSFEAEYKKTFQPYPSYKYFNNFVKKFLLDPDYRTKFEVRGKWSYIVDYESLSKYKINIICEYQINRLNEMKSNKLRFKHFKELRTGGLDDFSMLNREKLEDILPNKTITFVENELTDLNLVISALRWIGRGLKKELSIRKVITDKELQENASNKW